MPSDHSCAQRFHLALPCDDLAATLAFYVDVLGCRAGRSTDTWVIVDFFGQQVVLHHAPESVEHDPQMYPRHFGMVFDDRERYEQVLNRAVAAGADFFAEPFVRYAGTREEHRSFFLRDPSHNLIEFKAYAHDEAVLG